MDLIVAVDSNWGIGRNDRLLFRIREDHLRFRDMTVGKTVVLGRKTQQTFPGGRPLKNRTNIILTRNPDFEVAQGDAIVCHDLQALFKLLRSTGTGDVYVIGGESIYRQLLPYCERAHVTKIDYSTRADCFFPNLDASPDWVLEDETTHQTSEAEVIDHEGLVSLTYTYCTYRHDQVRDLPGMDHED